MVICSFVFVPAGAQRTSDTYVVLLKDKDTVNFSVSRPDAFLSARAIAKRQRFQLPIRYMDLPVNRAYLDTLSHLDSAVRVMTSSKWFNYAVIGTDDSVGGGDSLLERISSFAWVRGVYPTHQVPDSLFAVCFLDATAVEAVPALRTDTLYESWDSLPDEYWGKTAVQLNVLNGLSLHRRNYQGEGMLVAVIDNGFLYADRLHYFQSLRERGGIVCATDKSNDTTSLYHRTGSHGMMVLSIMAIREPYDYVGSAPSADYLLIRTERNDYEDILEEYYWVAGAEFADSVGADVVNSSLGYTTFNHSEQNHQWQDMDGKHSFASIAAENLCQTMVVNIAAGNEGMNEWRRISVPSDAPSVLCVAAASAEGEIAPFSSRGDSLGTTKPDVTSVGWWCAYCSTNDSIRSGNGTSFATPLNAGLSACLWQAFPEKTAKQVMQAIRESAHLYPEHLDDYGYGIPDYGKAFLLLQADNRIVRKEKSDFLLYPNPADGYCYLRTERGGEADLLNSLGQQVCSFRLHAGENLLQWHPLPAGVYYLRICQGGEATVQKIMIGD